MRERTVENSGQDGTLLPQARVLLVDNDGLIRTSLTLVLEFGGFEVVTATNVNDALKIIGSQDFDVLVSDLHMPGAGDGLTVVSAMRHSNRRAVTIIFSGYPAMKEAAAAAILLQADEILVANGPGDTYRDHPGAPEAGNSHSYSSGRKRGDDPRTKHAGDYR
jgi:CheY-like chemotaxis protein